jgi:hypothetical protein
MAISFGVFPPKSKPIGQCTAEIPSLIPNSLISIELNLLFLVLLPINPMYLVSESKHKAVISKSNL